MQFKDNQIIFSREQRRVVGLRTIAAERLGSLWGQLIEATDDNLQRLRRDPPRPVHIVGPLGAVIGVVAPGPSPQQLQNNLNMLRALEPTVNAIAWETIPTAAQQES